jgi:hypothetical protein
MADLGDPWSKSCLQTKACFGWETPFSFNRTCWYEVSYIHPRGARASGVTPTSSCSHLSMTCTLAIDCHLITPWCVLPRLVKQPLGQRLGRAALDLHYNMSMVHTVPVVQSCEVSGTSLTITFDSDKLTRGGASANSFPRIARARLVEILQMPWPHCEYTIESENDRKLSLRLSCGTGDSIDVQPYNRSRIGSSAMELLLGTGSNWTFAQITPLNASAVVVPLPAGTSAGEVSGVRCECDIHVWYSTCSFAC